METLQDFANCMSTRIWPGISKPYRFHGYSSLLESYLHRIQNYGRRSSSEMSNSFNGSSFWLHFATSRCHSTSYLSSQTLARESSTFGPATARKRQPRTAWDASEKCCFAVSLWMKDHWGALKVPYCETNTKSSSTKLKKSHKIDLHLYEKVRTSTERSKSAPMRKDPKDPHLYKKIQKSRTSSKRDQNSRSYCKRLSLQLPPQSLSTTSTSSSSFGSTTQKFYRVCISCSASRNKRTTVNMSIRSLAFRSQQRSMICTRRRLAKLDDDMPSEDLHAAFLPTRCVAEALPTRRHTNKVPDRECLWRVASLLGGTVRGSGFKNSLHSGILYLPEITDAFCSQVEKTLAMPMRGGIMVNGPQGIGKSHSLVNMVLKLESTEEYLVAFTSDCRG